MNHENNLQIIKTCFNVLLQYPKNYLTTITLLEQEYFRPLSYFLLCGGMPVVCNVFAFSPLLLPGRSHFPHHQVGDSNCRFCSAPSLSIFGNQVVSLSLGVILKGEGLWRSKATFYWWASLTNSRVHIEKPTVTNLNHIPPNPALSEFKVISFHHLSILCLSSFTFPNHHHGYYYLHYHIIKTLALSSRVYVLNVKFNFDISMC